MQQHLQRLDGVAKAEVSLRDGHVIVYPKEGGMLEPGRILKATYDSGVSVTEMEMTASGTVESSGSMLTLRVNDRQAFSIVPNALAERVRTQGGNRKVTLRGRLFQKPPGSGKPKELPSELKFEVLEVKDAP